VRKDKRGKRSRDRERQTRERKKHRQRRSKDKTQRRRESNKVLQRQVRVWMRQEQEAAEGERMGVCVHTAYGTNPH
jgi:RNA-binding protein 39